ncbi:MAG: sigma-54-dependent Fis family transcriptional regulator [Acidobacteria bacterium]|nr:MAG: sigma-54-dependent Fis family transcriptional regulator [Acidobacteriota bacterium]
MADGGTERHLLLVEDEPDQRRLVSRILGGAGYRVSEAAGVVDARAILDRGDVDVVVCDWKLPDGSGMEVLEAARASDRAVAFVVVTAYGTIAGAVDAVQAGADDYLAKPFERQALLLALDKALRARRLEDENRRLSEALSERDRLVDLVGSAPSMQKLFRQVEKLATTDATVLLTGESGTGKELAARALHALSRRASGPFVAVNCAAIPEGLIEAEFFGVEKGAYTGADRSRPGSFAAAAGGTLFLDEVGELPLLVQPKLLRALQEGRFSRVGSSREVQADVRLIAATNRDLAAAVAEGTFRDDLYYRLNVVPLRMPPLRERREDIPLLVEHFARRAARRHGIAVEPFPPALMRRLMDYSWPGNVRELGNAVERLVLLAEDGRVSSDDLPAGMQPRPPAEAAFRLPPAGLSWEAHERDCLRQALDLAGGNKARAARLLDLGYKAFLYRLEKYGLAAGDA